MIQLKILMVSIMFATILESNHEYEISFRYKIHLYIPNQ